MTEEQSTLYQFLSFSRTEHCTAILLRKSVILYDSQNIIRSISYPDHASLSPHISDLRNVTRDVAPTVLHSLNVTNKSFAILNMHQL
jgi:hypothetical protein